mgnify:CR=1 FL=1
MAKIKAQAAKAQPAAATEAPAAAEAPARKYFAPEDAGLPQRAVVYYGGESAFYLYHRPGCYYLKEGQVLPRLDKLHRIGGIANVGQTRTRNPATGRYGWLPDMSLAFADLNRHNCAVIPHGCDTDSGHPSYLMEIPGRPGKYAHRLQPLVPGMAPQPVPGTQWAAWLRSLMDRGIVDTPHPAEVQKVAAAAARMAEQHERAGEPRHAAAILTQLEALRASQAPPEATEAAPAGGLL